MTNRILSIEEPGSSLRVDLDRLVIERRDDKPTFYCPLNEIAVLVLEHGGILLSQAVLSRLIEAGGAVVVCDSQHLPVGMMFSLNANTLQTERFARQADASRPTMKRLWQETVRLKILAQARLLRRLNGEDGGLEHMAGRVRSGDPDNLEAQAARRYWPRMFPGNEFRRDRTAQDQNRHLNYGYAVLRAVVARALCAAGLHPSLGLHHHNRYNPYCLADDVMEPFRPLVDQIVASRVRAGCDRGEPLTREVRAQLLQPLVGRYETAGEERTLFDSLNRASAALGRVLTGECRDWQLGEVVCAAGLIEQSAIPVQLLLDDQSPPRKGVLMEVQSGQRARRSQTGPQ